VRWSKLFIPTLRELPAEGTVAEKWLVRAGYARAISTGVYGWLPLGQRVLEKLRRAARAELEAIGGQEVELTGAAASAIAAGELRSAKLLPQVWYRFEAGPLRARQMMGLEVFGFGANEAVVVRRLSAVLDRARLIFWNSGDALCRTTEAGLDVAVICEPCGGKGSARNAMTRPTAPPADPEGDFAPEEFHTPRQKTIADLSRFTGLPESAQMKSLVLVANGKPILVIYVDCLEAGLEALYDDRDERPGVKFKDADLIGVPLRINVGKKLAEGKVEVVERITKEITDVAVDEVVDICRAGRGV